MVHEKLTASSLIPKSSCKYCPSVMNKKNGVIDEEVEEMKLYSKHVIINEFLYDCAWRKGLLCKGFCNDMNITQDDIENYDTGRRKQTI